MIEKFKVISHQEISLTEDIFDKIHSEFFLPESKSETTVQETRSTFFQEVSQFFRQIALSI